MAGLPVRGTVAARPSRRLRHTVGPLGELVLPPDVLAAAGLAPGDEVMLSPRGGSIVIARA